MDNMFWAVWAFSCAWAGVGAEQEYGREYPAAGKWLGRLFLLGALVALAHTHPSLN